MAWSSCIFGLALLGQVGSTVGDSPLGPSAFAGSAFDGQGTDAPAFVPANDNPAALSNASDAATDPAGSTAATPQTITSPIPAPPSVMVRPNGSGSANPFGDRGVVQAQFNDVQPKYGDTPTSPRSPAPIQEPIPFAKDEVRPGDPNRPVAKAIDSGSPPGADGLRSISPSPSSGKATAGGATIAPRAEASVLRTPKTDSPKTATKADNTKSVKIEPAKSELDLATRAAANASADLLARSLIPPQDIALPGLPVSLQDALSRVLDRAGRLATARAYWKLSLCGAEYHWAIAEWRQLDATPTGRGAIDAPMLSTARAAAQARALESQALVVAAQHELAEALGQSPQNLPLTVDQPLVGPYRTHFETLFASRSAPGRLRSINKTLPLRREAIDVRTAAVQAAASAVHVAEEAYAKGQVPVQTLLAAQSELSRQRKAFVAAVRDYNLEIAEYALGVADPGTSNAVLVSMLTRTKPSTKTSSATAGAGTFATMNQPTLADPALDPDARPITADATTEGWSPAGGVRPATAIEDVGEDRRTGPASLEPRENSIGK